MLFVAFFRRFCDPSSMAAWERRNRLDNERSIEYLVLGLFKENEADDAGFFDMRWVAVETLFHTLDMVEVSAASAHVLMTAHAARATCKLTEVCTLVEACVDCMLWRAFSQVERALCAYEAASELYHEEASTRAKELAASLAADDIAADAEHEQQANEDSTGICAADSPSAPSAANIGSQYI